ncbi:MAG: transporter [Herbaspirillum sp.]|jgi:multidrug efflux system membrane fusion protein|nr:transporter [Herbaspirillum sp.]
MITSLPAKRSTLLIGGAVAVLLLGAGFSLSHRAESAPAPDPKANAISVSTALAKKQNVPLYLEGVGTVTANASVLVQPRVDGELQKVGFIEGQDVKAGQLLAQIDPRALQAQLAQMQAQKARDQAQLINAKADLGRYTTLLQQDAATQQQVDTQKALVAQLDAAVKTDDAQINYAQVQLSYTTITAPISGRAGVRMVDAGNIVHAANATGLVVINQIDPITVLFTLPEESVPAINRAIGNGAALKVVALARNNEQPLADGKLILLNNQIDTTNGTVQLKGRFPNGKHQLWPGQYVNVKLLLDENEQALTVPAAAIQRSQDGTYVYLIDDQENAKIQQVQVARIQDGVAVIAKGLQADQRVVVDGQYKLKPGARVVERQTAAAKGSAK